MNILVTGGAGYIGSHTIVELLKENHNVICIDNFYNSKEEVLDIIKQLANKDFKFYNIDLVNYDDVDRVFSENNIDAVIHFAGLKAVGESVQKPLFYYRNNLLSTINVLDAMKKYNVKNIVFSSSACVYGDPEYVPVTEESPVGNVTNPYGRTKYFIEEILRDYAVADPEFKGIILRYFNPIGAHESGLLGENPLGIPNNLMPFILRAASKEADELKIFGNDYSTPDGTTIRDYIHVVDLAIAHTKAIDKLKDDFSIETYNLGTGKGTSVQEIVDSFNRVNGNILKYSYAPRRPGDAEKCYADPTKANKELHWYATKTIDDMCKDSWNYKKNYNDKKAK
ncbi:MAG: UDP-glucose 4-epimerase GalE [Clostridia bacterium]|nr:UDP-glucose 4-epimerase GalE [Clostridia bacterium]